MDLEVAVLQIERRYRCQQWRKHKNNALKKLGRIRKQLLICPPDKTAGLLERAEEIRRVAVAETIRVNRFMERSYKRLERLLRGLERV